MSSSEPRNDAEQEHLAIARAQLTREQRDHLAQIVDLRLREEDAYDAKYEIMLAQTLYEGRSHVHEWADIEEIITRAYNEAREKEAKERWLANLPANKKVDVQREPLTQSRPVLARPKPEASANPPQDSPGGYLGELLALAQEELGSTDNAAASFRGRAV